MTAEQIFRFIRIAAPLTCALALALAASAWQQQLYWLVAANCFLAGALADAGLNAWFIMRTIFRARPAVKVSGVDSTVWMQPPVSQDPVAAAIRQDICPDCGTPGLILRACGGASINVECYSCSAKFNAHGANLRGQPNLRNTFMVDRL